MLKRLVNLPTKKSFFLFGPRGAGKSTLLHSSYQKTEHLYLDFLDLELVDELSLNPKRFVERILDSQSKIIVIDEVQKLPRMLEYVHSLIEKKRLQFVLTGSSARRLKQKGINLLAGRALIRELYPFSTFELEGNFDLTKALQRGTLPEAYLAETDADAADYLRAYSLTYLEKEIQQEQWVRNLDPFRRFLPIASQMNGKIINRAAIARDVGVDDMTIQSYFDILEDTYIGFHLPAFDRSVRKQQRQAPKFYFVDTGLKRALDKTTSVPLLPQTSAYGDAFEHWIVLEFQKLTRYFKPDWTLHYLMTKEGAEIDLIVKRPGEALLLIEIKSTVKVSEHDAKILNSLGDEFDGKTEKLLLSRDPVTQNFSSTRAKFWIEGLRELFFHT